MKNFCPTPSKPIKAIKNITKIRHKTATTAPKNKCGKVGTTGELWKPKKLHSGCAIKIHEIKFQFACTVSTPNKSQ